MMQVNKIFGIGLPRTGTSSLSKALRILGFDVHHSKPRFQIYRYMNYPKRRHKPRYSLKFLDDPNAPYQGFTDTPGNLVYKEMDETYPDSKFILTVRRNKEEWHHSCQQHWSRRPSLERGDTLRYFRNALFGCADYDQEKFQATYDRHDKGVIEHFGNRDSLLIMDICAGDHWEKLCPFLDVPIPDKRFPWKHRTK